MIQESRGELNDLRSMALDHQQCNCHVAKYNDRQAEWVVAEWVVAEWVVAEYQSSCSGHRLGGLKFPLNQHSIRSQ
jgi:hypothetical protein